MAKVLKVINQFFTLEVGDTFTLTEDGKMYTSQHNEEFHKAGEENEISSSFNATFNISKEYAKELIDEGYLEEVVETTKKNTNFVNVFDEIDSLIARYSNDLKNIDLDLAGQPECLRVEKTTVLKNILSVLDHLKTLRK